MIDYGPRDAASVLMDHGHKVGWHWRGDEHWWVLDGKRVTGTQLEDAAEKHERLRDRMTARPNEV
jgi:hypothetical protein